MEKGKLNEILISGIAYIPKDSVTSMAPVLDGMEYCMVRTLSLIHIYCNAPCTRHG